ncbi:MAG: EamA family transporter [Bacillota bacterium]|nr:EamA family transporter [Bacillota bacterium]NLM08998.1 EamA family transporter [Clostridiales Family XIII bacterium]HOA42848.1 EamA family transporter [Bacillota bacterium]
MLNYYWPILLIITSNVCYHISAKSMPGTINPLASLGVTYIVAAIATFLLYFLTSPAKNLATEYGHLNWTPFLLGIAIVGLEFGNVWMYKVGWNISIGSLVCNIALAVILIIIGVMFYKEMLTVQKIIGLGLCLGGLILINK